ncbi:MAG: hypothetical protein NC209_07995 [Alistipes sp.]|nr:hypothetical protein [Alistipes senegalensis]MCM1251063.1 hypothetical protein [Alistipes sp.]
MKKWGFIIGAAVLTAGLTGCSSAYFASAGYGNDDLYAIHDKTEIAQRKQAEAERKKAEAEARRAEWEARIAEAEAEAAQNRYYASTASNPYEEVLADSFQSAYARRLKGFQSPTYRMPSSYYNFRYGNAFTYVSAYDPAFYNVMVMGDEVWVEPKYITAMFGTWGRPAFYSDPWYYGWNWRPYYNWGFSFGSWGWGFGAWYDPWYYPAYGWNYGWGPGWGPGWHGHPHWGGGPGPAHRRYASDIVHRADPNGAPGLRYSNSGRRPGSSGVNPSGTSSWRSSGNGSSGRFGVRNGGTSIGNRQTLDSAPTSTRRGDSGNRFNSGSSFRNNSGGNTYNRGGSNSGSSFRSNSSSGSSGSSYRGGSSGSGGSGTRSSGGASRNAGGR